MIPQRNFSKKGRLRVKKGRLKVLLMRTKYTWRLSNSGGSDCLWSAHASSHGASTVDFTARVRLRNGSRSAARESVVRRCAWSRAVAPCSVWPWASLRSTCLLLGASFPLRPPIEGVASDEVLRKTIEGNIDPPTTYNSPRATDPANTPIAPRS